MIRQEDFDRLLSSEERVVPSAGFADAVMRAVRREAAVPPPISFPWKCALPGLALAGLLALALLLVPLPTVRAEIAILASTRLPVLLATMPEMARRLGLDWLMLALLLAWASVKLSTRLASWKS